MELSRAASVLSFVGALVIGIAVGYSPDERRKILTAKAPVGFLPLQAAEPTAVTAEDLVGVWRGTWGYNRADCTIEIHRTQGNKFWGTLRKGKAKVSLAGTLEAVSRTVSFRETKVVSHGEYHPWSLGTNTGSFSRDGRTLTGTGSDEYGSYGWNASKDQESGTRLPTR